MALRFSRGMLFWSGVVFRMSKITRSAMCGARTALPSCATTKASSRGHERQQPWHGAGGAASAGAAQSWAKVGVLTGEDRAPGGPVLRVEARGVAVQHLRDRHLGLDLLDAHGRRREAAFGRIYAYTQQPVSPEVMDSLRIYGSIGSSGRRIDERWMRGLRMLTTSRATSRRGTHTARGQQANKPGSREPRQPRAPAPPCAVRPRRAVVHVDAIRTES